LLLLDAPVTGPFPINKRHFVEVAIVPLVASSGSVALKIDYRRKATAVEADIGIVTA
jgi:hypothetical protein